MLIERKWKKWVYFYLPMALFIVFTLFPDRTSTRLNSSH